MTADQIRSLQPALAALLERFREFFNREATFGHWERYLTGLMTDLKRKSVEPIALASGVAVRTLQEFLAFFVWDHERIDDRLQQMVMDDHASEAAIGVFDSSGHAKQGCKTPGVKRQWCGETGKVDNCVVGQHLLYTDNHPTNPFTCMLASDLYIPKEWIDDTERCTEAGMPEDLEYRPKWQMAIDQLRRALGNGVQFRYVTFDEEYGQVPQFWFELDALGQRAIGEVPRSFSCWATRPHYRSLQTAHAPKRADGVCQHSPLFTRQPWRRVTIKATTRGPMVWEVKAARIHLTVTSQVPSLPTDRAYWLIVARSTAHGEIKYFVSNAPASADLKEMLTAAFARWHVEKWFERAKQETGFGDFEVRTYTSLIRHWLCSRMAMYFLAEQTQRLRGEKSADHAGAGGPGHEPADHDDWVSPSEREPPLALVG